MSGLCQPLALASALIGLRVQAPEVAVAALFNPQDDILCLSMHPLQNELGKDLLKRHLSHEVQQSLDGQRSLAFSLSISIQTRSKLDPNLVL